MQTKGLTLVETITYIAIVSMFLIAMFTFSQHVIQVRNKSRTMEETQQNARFIMERLAQEIRGADSIDEDSTLGSNLAHGGWLHLNKTDSAEDIYFQINADNQITVKTGSTGSEQVLTSSLLIADELIFTDISTSEDYQAIKIKLLIKYKNNDLPEYNWEVDLQDTITIRLKI